MQRRVRFPWLFIFVLGLVHSLSVAASTLTALASTPEGADAATNTLLWAAAEFRAFEKEGIARLLLRRGGSIETELPVSIELVFETAGPKDISGVATNLVFPPGIAEQEVTLTLIDDPLRENRESILFRVHPSLATEDIVIERSESRLIILDDETPGTPDPLFRPAAIYPGALTAVQPDGRLIIAVIAGTKQYLVRLDRHGQIDPSFNTNALRISSPAFLASLSVVPSGQIYVGGIFNLTNSFGRNNLVRLLPTGEIDFSFNPRLSSNALFSPGSELLVAPASDRKLWVAMRSLALSQSSIRFESDPPPAPYPNLARLNWDGSLDPAFRRGQRILWLREIEPLANGGVLCLTDSLLHFLSDGTRSTNLPANLVVPHSIKSIAADGDSAIFVGDFREASGRPVEFAARVRLSDGKLDSNFVVRANGPISNVEIADHKIYVAGSFTRIGEAPRPGLARLNADGSLDATFDPGLGPVGLPGILAIAPEGDLLLRGGWLQTFDGIPATNFARLEGDRAPGVIRLATRRVEVLETSPFAEVIVERVHGATGPLAARLRPIDGAATAGSDYESGEIEVTFADGEMGPKPVHIPLLQSTNDLHGRTFAVQLRSGTTLDEAAVSILEQHGPFLDSRFHLPVAGAANAIRDFALGSDGAVYLAGDFTNVAGVAITNLARLKPDLTLDHGFRLAAIPKPAESAGNQEDHRFAPIEHVAVRPSGQVLFSGNFVEVGGERFTNLAQVGPDGAYDKPFICSNMVSRGITGIPRDLVLQPDGKLLAANGATVQRIALDGNRDGTFSAGSFSADRLALLPDGTFLAFYDSWPVAKANSRGQRLTSFSLSTSFRVGTSSGTSRVSVGIAGPNDTLYVGGIFTHVGSVQTEGVARLLTNGAPFLLYSALLQSGESSPETNAVRALALLPNGDLLVGGSRARSGGRIAPFLTMLNAAGAPLTNFSLALSGTAVEEILVLPDGSALVRGAVTHVNGMEVEGLFRLAFIDRRPPSVNILWPVDRSELLPTNSTLDIQIAAYSPQGFLQKIYLELDGAPAFTFNLGHLSVPIPMPSPGPHSIRVVAEDHFGAFSEQTVAFSVRPSAPPSLSIRRTGSALGIHHDSGKLETSADLQSWTEVHADGGEYQLQPSNSRQFFRAIVP